MYKPDEDIDNLGRDAAERYNPPGAPSWDALEKVLNVELPVEEEKKRRGFFFFFLLLLGLSVAGTAIWYGVSNSNKQTLATNKPANTEKQTDNNAIAQQKNSGEKEILDAEKNNTLQKGNNKENLETNKTSSNKTINAADNNDNSVTRTQNSNSTPVINKTKGENNSTPAKNIVSNNAVASLKPVNKASAKNKLLPSSFNNTPNTTDNNKPGTVANLNTSNTKRKNQKANQYQLSTTGSQDINNQTVAAVGRPNKNKSKGNKENKASVNNVNLPLAANGNDDVDTQNASNSNGNDLTTATTSNKPKETPVSVAPVAQDSSVTNNTIKPTTPAIDTTAVVKKDSSQKKKNKTNREKALLFGITGGFDYSTVKFRYSENAGYNIGLIAGYQFSKHWSVYTGAVYTKKNYKLAGKDYNPPQHYFTRYVDLQMVDGYCRMWEIPLQARYTFNPAAKTAFFASAGLSSYFMTKQAYDYTYKDSWGQQLSSSWGTDSTFNHVFSILHLSVGFQKPLGKHMNWQIEPYAKIPLGGVGFGNIRLSSFGINFSVQYRHPVKR
ncbi:MAG: porin family protein [Chitinophagaceae bacterium]